MARNKQTHTLSPITAYNDTISVVSGYFRDGFIVLLGPAIKVPTEIQILDFKDKSDGISDTTLKLNGHNNEQQTSCSKVSDKLTVVQPLRRFHTLRLHNEELNDLYCSPNIVRVIKSRRM